MTAPADKTTAAFKAIQRNMKSALAVVPADVWSHNECGERLSLLNTFIERRQQPPVGALDNVVLFCPRR